MKYSYVIIDDDEKAVDDLRAVLKNFPNYYCRGVASDEAAAIDLILEQMPKIIFLEVEVPGIYNDKCGFSLLGELKHYLKELPDIFVLTKTADYAIQAIKNDVSDYILKPTNVGEFRRSLLRYEKKKVDGPETICIKSYGDYRFIEIADVEFLKADNNCTDFFMKNGNKISAFKTLKYFEQTLPENFVRIHNSYIINTNRVSRIHFGKSKCSFKSSEQLVPFSRSYKKNVESIKNVMNRKSVIEF
ncbi:response regulator [Leptobacterium flavescens]|uniref:Response regulator n=1 Tax=Leptobacterium flavescens TaxID=472055 RepID=A0A6P0UPK4_9FLAO|nr:LytTR family DNA-binding domain-containing protein [Leptobacterium flavescens]NER12296.1 response regulator [Leptobacterium flavescens]